MVSLVGYTNAGKSTLLNALTGAQVYAANQLFATLDPTTRRLVLPGGREILLTDTVGFIQKLPTDLVAAFRATLEEVSEADLLLHVVDITHVNALEQAATVAEVLAEIGATDKPIVTALNKIDRLPAEELARTHELRARFAGSIPVSALTGQGLENLIVEIEELLTETFSALKVHIPYREGELVALFHQRGLIEEETHDATGTTLSGRLPARLVPLFDRYRVAKPRRAEMPTL